MRKIALWMRAAQISRRSLSNLKSTRLRSVVAAIAAATLLFSALPVELASASAAGFVMPTAVNLRTASSYALFGSGAIANTGKSTINGDIGTPTANGISGYGTSTVTGAQRANEATSSQTVADVLAAYNDAAGRTNSGPGYVLVDAAAGAIATYTPGVYTSLAAIGFGAGSTITLDAQNVPNAVFIFQVNGAINLGANMKVVLANGAVASNIFWQSNGATNVGADATFAGIVLSNGAANLGARAVFVGSLLSNAAVNTDQNTVSSSDYLKAAAAPPAAPTVAIDGAVSVITNNRTPSITGTTTAVTGQLTVTVGSQTFTPTVSSSGTWTVTPTTLADGTYAVNATATNGGGTTNAIAHSLKVDATAPAVPTITSPALTNSTTPTITGTAEVGDIMTVDVCGTIYHPVVGSDGKWSLPVTTALAEGTCIVKAFSTDDAGNTSPVATQNLVVDLTPPAVPTITSPALTNSNTPTITGTADVGTTMTVDVCGTIYHPIVGTDGKWALPVTIPTLADGTCAVKAFSTDGAGNKSPVASQNLVVDTTAPVAPTITSSALTNNPTPTITGTGEVGTTMTVDVCGTIYHPVIGTDGKWSLPVTTALADGTCAVKAFSTDNAGNKSPVATQNLVVKTSAPASPTITSSALTSSTTPTITGTADAGTTVTVDVCGTTYHPIVGADGKWSVPVTTALSEGTCVVKAFSTDNAGNTSPVATQNLVVDLTPPAVPTITSPALTNSTTPTITGTADAGTTMTVDVCGTIYRPVVGADGKWSLPVTTPALTEGTCVVKAFSTDPAGNKSAAATQNLVVDTTPPAVPTITSPALTNSTTPTITGTAEVGSVMTVDVCGTVYHPVVGADGKWSLPVTTALAEGTCAVKAFSTDRAGNTSATATQNLVVDTTPPAVPTITSNALTNSTTPTITGTAEIGSVMTVDVCGTTYHPVVGADGKWSLPVTTALAEGTCIVKAFSTDAAGNKSPTATQNLVVDTTPPTIPTITSPALTNSKTPTLTGTAEVGDIMTVDVCGTIYHPVVGADGNWSLPVTTPLADGTCVVKVFSTDPAGNKSPTATQNLVVDTTPPGAPTITGGAKVITSNTRPTIGGTAEPGSTVTVDICGQPFSRLVGADGTWTWSVALAPPATALLPGDCVVTAFATDAAGNKGESVTQTITVDTSVPAVEVTGGALNTTNSFTPKITGTTTAAVGTKVTVTVAGQTLITTVLAGGTWTVTPTTLTEGPFAIVVTVIGAAGTTGTGSQTLTVSPPKNDTLAQTIAPEGNVIVTGQGFTDAEVVQVWFYSTPMQVGTLTAGPGGTIAGNFAAPANAPAGTHHIIFIGSAGTQLASQPITIVAALPRTGTDITPVWYGLGFLVIGGLAITFTARARRRAKLRSK